MHLSSKNVLRFLWKLQ